MRIHHLNCGTLCPISRALFNGKGGLIEPGELVCHCLLIETEQGLVLVDTGLGREEVQRGFLSPILDTLSPPRYALHETAWEQIKALGLDPNDVRHIVLTHLDLDHAGGLSDFPQARVHLHRQEYLSGARPAGTSGSAICRASGATLSNGKPTNRWAKSGTVLKPSGLWWA